MTIQAVLILLVSASIHVSWNFLSKRSRATIAFFLVAVLMSLVVFSPIGWIYHSWLPFITPPVWGLLGLTSVFQSLYYVGLSLAYRRGELSVVYPLVRALPVIMVALMSWLLGRANQIAALGIVGMLLVAFGCMILPLQNFPSRLSPPKKLSLSWSPVLFFALLAAIGTTGYTIVDDLALRILRDVPAFSTETVQITLFYTFLEGIGISLLLILLVVLIPAERREINALSRQSWINAAFSGVFMLLAYGLVLIAMAYVRDVSYVSAFRQTSIPLGALVGLLVEKEKAYPPKVLGVISISIGLVLVALG